VSELRNDSTAGKYIDWRTRTTLALCTSTCASANATATAPVVKAGSKYRGVYWYQCINKWRAQLQYDGKNHNLGSFEDEKEAARAYDRAARAQRGEKTQLNFPAGAPRKSSKYRGAYWNKRDNKWAASIRSDGKLHHLGCFEDEEEAARAYDKAARAHHGEKAQLNFPAEGESGSRGSSKCRGVHLQRNKWAASIRSDGKLHHLGLFEDEEEAAMAYDRAARAQHGEKAHLNYSWRHKSINLEVAFVEGGLGLSLGHREDGRVEVYKSVGQAENRGVQKADELAAIHTTNFGWVDALSVETAIRIITTQPRPVRIRFRRSAMERA
jgi:hypothetical protein